MHSNKDLWLNNVHSLSKKFVEDNYSEELFFFDTFWQIFSIKLNEVIKSHDAASLFVPMSPVVSELSFARGYSQDFITPIATLIIAEVLHELNEGKYTAPELEDIIHSSATLHGAKNSLTACLIRSLPSLCNEIMICKNSNPQEALIRESPRPSEYRIWTEGIYIVSDNIEKYVKKKGEYLLWIDLSAKQHVSSNNPEAFLHPRAVHLLLCLVEHIGTTLSVEYVIKHVYKGNTSLTLEHDKGKIAQHITQLNNFCGGRGTFDSYLSANWRHAGLCLRKEFEDKYFLFSRVLPNKD